MNVVDVIMVIEKKISYYEGCLKVIENEYLTNNRKQELTTFYDYKIEALKEVLSEIKDEAAVERTYSIVGI